jgi:hypothetical protein
VIAPVRFPIRALAVACVLAAPLAACSRADNTPPVATATFSASRTRVPLGSPVELTYKFDVAPGAKISGDYRVFVHVVDADGKPMSWSDDHDPPTPTSQWKPGQTIGPYTRTVFVPVVPYVGEATVRIGLYNKAGQRLPLTGADPNDKTAANREYKVGTLQILPASDNLLVFNKSGWNQDEYDANNPTSSWKWTQKLATLSFKNPKKDVTFFLDYDARSDIFADHPQVVTVYSGDQVVATFPADATSQTLRRIPISAAQLGGGEMADLRIEVDKTFIPANMPNGGNDRRELGIRVYHTFIEPKG